MKLIAALLLIGATTAPAFAGGPVIRRPRSYQPGWSQEQKHKRISGKYVPGTAKNPGYVRTYKKRVEVPCERDYIPQTAPHYHHEEPPQYG